LESTKKKESPSSEEDLIEVKLRYVWADNGDVISIQYAGTPAVRGDVTRTGKGTIVGLINDGINSLTRYYLNNFYDGEKQDSIDLFLGKSKLHTKATKKEDLVDKGSILLTIISTILILFHLTRPYPSSTGAISSFQFVIILFWLPFILLIWLLSSLCNKKIGRKIVSKPSLANHVNDYEK